MGPHFSVAPTYRAGGNEDAKGRGGPWAGGNSILKLFNNLIHLLLGKKSFLNLRYIFVVLKF